MIAIHSSREVFPTDLSPLFESKRNLANKWYPPHEKKSDYLYQGSQI